MLNVFVQFFITACCLCGVQIAATYDVTVGRVKVKGVRDIVEFAKRKILGYRISSKFKIPSSREAPAGKRDVRIAF